MVVKHDIHLSHTLTQIHARRAYTVVSPSHSQAYAQAGGHRIHIKHIVRYSVYAGKCAFRSRFISVVVTLAVSLSHGTIE